ncbi:MAG: ATP synthase subunit I [Pseudomonas sp.]
MPFYRQVAFPLLLAQLAMTLLLGLTGWLFFSRVVGLSAGLGGLIAWIPNLYFAYKSFRYFGARSVKAIVQSIWSGEMGKLILTAVLFALVFAGVEQVNVAALFVGYVAVLGIAASSLLLVKGFPKH